MLNGPKGETVTQYITLDPHQQLGVELAEVNDKYAFFYDTRTGKTPMSLAIMAADIAKNPHHKWLVLCPLILIENAWLPDAAQFFPDLKVVNLHGTTKAQRLKAFKEKGNIYVANIESFISYQEHIEALNVHGAIVDESSVMKSNSSKFGKAAVEYSMTLKRWYLLSGSPAPNGENEYFRQLQSVDFYGIHKSYAQFVAHFFVNMSRNPQYEKLVCRSDRYEELMGFLRKYSLYVDKEDVLKTPGRDFLEVELELPEALKGNYRELKSNLALELGNNIVITSPSTAANLNKLNQVTSGFVIDTHAMKWNKANPEGPKMTEQHILDYYRFIKLNELLQSLGTKQAIVWCTYRKEFEIIKTMLGERCGLVYGDVNIAEKNTAIRAFKDGSIQFLIANPASADKGLTLTNAHHAIYFSLGYSYELWKQSIERIYGDIRKQPERCTYHIFIASGTIDRVIYDTVQKKGDMSTAVLEHLKGGL
ncbi:ATP-dependent RNA helicase DbpA [compost metagenome]